MKKRILVLVLTIAMLLQSVPMSVKADNVETISVSENSLSENGLNKETANDIESFVAGHIAKGNTDVKEELPTSYLPKAYEESIKAERVSNFAENEGFDFSNSFISESTRIRRQLGGTCWAEASVAMMETNLLKHGYITKDDVMSVDSVVLNNAYGYDDRLGNYNNKKDCTSTIKQTYNKGGMESFAFSIWSLYRGITFDSDINLNQYNYITHPTTGEIIYNPQGWEKFSHMNEFTDEETLAKSVFHLNTMVEIPCYNVDDMAVSNSRGGNTDYDYTTIPDIKKLIQEYGAVTTAYDGTHAKATYNGENEAPSITTHGYTYSLHDHAVCIVGWDDFYNKNNDKYSEKSKSTVSMGAWLIKQSYGSELYYTDARTGERKCNRTGYMWLPYNESSMSGVIMCSGDFDTADRYTNMYTYSGSCDESFLTRPDYNTSVTIFTANADKNGNAESIDGVMLGSKGGAEYTVSVWLNPEVVDGKLKGVKVSEVNGTLPFGDALNGLFTVDFVKENKSVVVENGQKYAIVVQSTNLQSTLSSCEKESVCYYGNNMEKFEDAKNLKGYRCYPNVRALTNPTNDAMVYAESISLTDKVINLKENESRQIRATILPSSTTLKNCGFASSDTSVATVSDDGVVNAVGYGTAVITVLSQDGKASAECIVNVGAYSLDLELKLKVPSGTCISDDFYWVEYGGSITPKFLLKGITIDKVSLTSSDNSVMKVDADGTLHALKEGTAVIRCTLYAKDNFGNPQNLVTSKTVYAKSYYPKVSDDEEKNDNEDDVTPPSSDKPTVDTPTDNPTVDVPTDIPTEEETDTEDVEDVEDEKETEDLEDTKTEESESEVDLSDGFDYKGLSYMLIDGDMWVYDCTKRNTTKVTIPSTITVNGKKYKVSGISEDAFYNLKKLKTVTIGSNVKVISGYAFYGCEKLKTVKIGKNVTKIKTNAFANCKALKKITIPSKVKEIGSYAFGFCKNLKTITIKSKVLKKVNSKAFYGIGKKAKIKVPKSKKKTYKKLIKVSSDVTIK